MTTLLPITLALTGLAWIIHGLRSRAARRLQHALDSYAEREIARATNNLQRRSHS